jgi:hypothetical protein
MRGMYKNNPALQTISTLASIDLESIKSDASVFIETGTNIGNGVQKALDSGFSKVISFENNDLLYRGSVKRFQGDDRVKLFFGDSRACLLDVIKDIEEKMLFWLDGHDYHDIPLIEELNQIKSLKRNDHVILIDDVRMMDTREWDNLKKSDVERKVMEINSEYKLYYIDSVSAPNDIMVAHV